MAEGVNVGVAYVSIVPETKNFASQLESAIKSSGSRAGQSLTDQFKGHGKSAGQGFGKSFGSELSSTIPGLSSLKQTLAGYEGAAAKSGALAGKALGAAFTAAAGAAIGAAGYTLFKGFERYQALDAAKHRLDNLNKTFLQLGKTGVDVASTMKIVNEAVEGTPYSLSDAFTQATSAIASGVTDVKKYMTDVADAAAFAGDDINRIGQAFTQVINQGKLDAGLLQNQLVNLPIKSWLKEVYGAQVDITKAIEDGQIGIEQLQYVIEKFASGTAKTAGDTIAGSIENMQTAFARLGANILSALFGGPTEDGVNGLKAAIDSIRDKIDQLNTWVVDHKAAIKDAFETGVQVVQDFIGVIGKIKDILDDIGVGIDDVVVAFAAWKTIAGISALQTSLTGINTMVGTTLPASAAAASAKMASSFGPVLSILSEMERIKDRLSNNDPSGAVLGADPLLIGRGVDIGRSLGNSILPWIVDGTPVAPPGAVSPGGDAITGSDGKTYNRVPSGTPGAVPIPGKNEWGIPATSSSSAPSGGREPGWGGSGDIGPPPALQPGKDDKGEKDKKPPKPVIPFDQTLPGWVANTPMTPSFFSAESSWLNARHDLAQARAELDQLEKSNWATAEEIQAARNRVLEQQRDMDYQDMQLQKARVDAYEEFYKTGKKQVDQVSGLAESMGGIVQLDQDLGISRGLVGLADNLFRFLMNLAAAPIKGLLAGAQAGFAAQLPPGFPGSTQQGPTGINGAMNMYQNMFGGMFGQSSSSGKNTGLQQLFANYQPGQNVFSGQHVEDTGGLLTPRASAMKNLLASMFPGLEVGGYRQPDGYNEHSSGEALDIMIGENAALGTQINKFLLDNAQAFGLQYTLFNQAQWKPGGQITPMEDRGDPTQNHFDHIHGRFLPGPIGPQGPVYNNQLFPYDPLKGYAAGGPIPGSGSGDRIPVLAEPGEHMLSRKDVAAMGGQAGVYSFRNALHRQGGGSILWPLDLPNNDLTGPANTDPGLTPPLSDPTTPSPASSTPTTPNLHQGLGLPPGPGGPPGIGLGPDGEPISPYDQPITGPDGKPIMGLDGKPLTENQLAGFIPKAAAANNVAGTSNLSNIWMMGAEVVNGIIDQAGQAASTAAAVGLAAGTMGAGAAGSPAASAAASFVIGMGTEAAKRGVSYAAQMGGIWSDALVEQLFPFGAPTAIGFDSAKNSMAGVYDSGGMLPPGGVGINLSRRPEPVLTQDQWDLMSKTSTGARSYGINIENVQVKDVEELSRTLDQRQRLAMMRYAGRP